VLDREQRDWNKLATLDPKWAILSRRQHKFGRWDPAEFFAEGTRDVERFLGRARRLGYPREWRAVLDFGCGVGRLAPGLSAQFDEYCGVDLSRKMVGEASDVHRARPNCRFLVNDDTTLEQLPDDSFDLIFTLYVLQHITDRPIILRYLQSFVRLLRPGGLLVFQLPDHIPKVEKLFYDTRRNLFIGFEQLGIPGHLMFTRLGLHPMTMNFVPEELVVARLEAEQATLLRVESGRCGVAIRDRTYYATHEI